MVSNLGETKLPKYQRGMTLKQEMNLSSIVYEKLLLQLYLLFNHENSSILPHTFVLAQHLGLRNH